MKSSYQQIADNFRRHVPHAEDLGIRILEVDRGLARLALDFREELLGDAERGLIHTGVITSMIDSACGIAVIAAADGPVTVATLDLRMDYLRPALRDHALHARAECYRLTRHIAFVRAQAWQESETRLVATSTSVFMLQLRRKRKTATGAI